MEKMMGLDQPVDFVVDQKLSRVEKWARPPKMAGVIFRLVSAFIVIDKHVANFRANFNRIYKNFSRTSLKWKSNQDLFEHFLKDLAYMFILCFI